MKKTAGRKRPSAAVAFRNVMLAGSALLISAAAGCAPVSQDVLQQLPAGQARELKEYSTQHAIVFDLRIHSMETCPFLTYLPKATFMDHNSDEYAQWLHHFYGKKHEEERNLWRCTCEQKLLAPAETSLSAGQ